MKRHPADDKPDMIAFQTVNREINLLLKRLRNVCPCCIAHVMMYRGAILHADIAGPEDTVALCMAVAYSIERRDDAEISDTQH